MAGFGLFLPGPVKLRMRPRTLWRATLSAFSLLLSRELETESDSPRPLLAKMDRSDTSNGAVVNPLALTTQDYKKRKLNYLQSMTFRRV